MAEETRIFKSFLRGLLRHLNALKEALSNEDYEKAETLLDNLIEDTKKGIEDCD